MMKAQSIAEYVILIGIVALVLVGMQVYMKRGIQGVVKRAADEIGAQKDAEEIDVLKGTKQNSVATTLTQGNRRVQTFLGGGQEVIFDTTMNTNGTQIYTSEKEK